MSAARDSIHGRWCPDSSDPACEDMTALLNEVVSDERERIAAALEQRGLALRWSAEIDDLLTEPGVLSSVRQWEEAAALVRSLVELPDNS